MLAMFRAIYLAVILVYALAFAALAADDPKPENAEPENAVEKALETAEQLSQADKANETPAASEAPAQENREMESSETVQPTYPGIKNLIIQRGGDGVPPVKLNYPETGNAAVDAALKRFVEDLANDFESEVKSSAQAEQEPPSSYGYWEETGSFTISRPNPDILSVTFNIFYYTGGVHGQMLVHVMNFNLKTGKELSFDDLFAHPAQAIAILSEVSEKKLRETLGDEVEEDMLRSGTAPEADNFSQIALVPDGVVAEFQPYQVGPWSIGQQHANVSLQELAPAGPNPVIWPDSVQK